MRRLWILLGLIPLGACTAAGVQALSGASQSSPIVIERGAVPLPVALTRAPVTAPDPITVTATPQVQSTAAITPPAQSGSTSVPTVSIPRSLVKTAYGIATPPVLPPANAVRSSVPAPASATDHPEVRTPLPAQEAQPSRVDPPPSGEPTAVPPSTESGPATTEGNAAAGQEEVPSGLALQCQGLTRAGARCRRKTRDASGFCYQHRPPPAP